MGNFFADGEGTLSGFGGAFFKKLPGVRGEEPRVTAFLFCKAFFFVPFASKKKASSGEGAP